MIEDSGGECTTKYKELYLEEDSYAEYQRLDKGAHLVRRYGDFALLVIYALVFSAIDLTGILSLSELLETSTEALSTFDPSIIWENRGPIVLLYVIGIGAYFVPLSSGLLAYPLERRKGKLLTKPNVVRHHLAAAINKYHLEKFEEAYKHLSDAQSNHSTIRVWHPEDQLKFSRYVSRLRLASERKEAVKRTFEPALNNIIRRDIASSQEDIQTVLSEISLRPEPEEDLELYAEVYRKFVQGTAREFIGSEFVRQTSMILLALSVLFLFVFDPAYAGLVGTLLAIVNLWSRLNRRDSG